MSSRLYGHYTPLETVANTAKMRIVLEIQLCIMYGLAWAMTTNMWGGGGKVEGAAAAHVGSTTGRRKTERSGTTQLKTFTKATQSTNFAGVAKLRL